MANEKYVELDMNSIKEIDGKLYAPVSHKNKLTGGKEVIPIFFAKTIQTKILHDSPTIGVWSYGKRSFTVDGPFLSDNEALSVIQRRAEQVDQIGYEFDSEVISRCYPSDQFPISLKTYFERSMGTETYSKFSHFPEVNGYHLDPKEFAKLVRQLSDLYKKIIAKLAAISNEHRMNDDEFIAVIGNTYLNSSFKELRWEKHLIINTFSEESDNLSGVISKMFNEEGFAQFSDRLMHKRKYIIASPGPKPSIDHNSIDDFVKAHDFIY